MKRFVLDTSVVVKWFSEEKDSDKARKLLKSFEEKKIEIILPALVKYELANAFLKGKQLSYPEAKIALETFYNLSLLFVEETLDLAKDSYLLGKKLNLSYYDACFLALAKSQKASLITANPKHQKRIKGIKILTL